MQLKGKNVVLTGGQGGIGRVLAQKLTEAEASVTVVDRGEGPSTRVCDLSNGAAVEELCAELKDGKTDILINLAGLMYFGHTQDQPAGNLEAMLRVNLQTPIRLAQAVLPGMLARGRGQIVNIGSVFGSIPFPHFTTYSATKAGMKAFSEALRREYAGRGITVTHIAPRAVKTGLNGGAIATLHARTKTVNDSPEKVATIVLEAIQSDRKCLTIGFPEKLFARINAIAPAVIDKALVSQRDIANSVLHEMRA
ncbi:MAG: SDR family NAD(P)-dependent oxidoreductase [Rhodospirillales bacterium]|nr:SDR family NAD(P)-dependent oxidoreductase [Alphaproteobacteria bacterium]MCB9986377.1 SDR family NAD(P)-dependent oxidoreductase [Rhodospirillales bacterium]USO07074.1 MAG: SDR family NAD(P)-dependent oxidoreductase [Rhodospirillales bacterium]